MILVMPHSDDTSDKIGILPGSLLSLVITSSCNWKDTSDRNNTIVIIPKKCLISSSNFDILPVKVLTSYKFQFRLPVQIKI